ncbi:MAG: tetratricopeptide repeat protein [Armatimonadota bacterium]
MNTLRWIMLLAGLLLLALPVLADDDDEDGAGTLTPELQWKMADAAWNRREYDTAAVACINFAVGNPDHDNALEAWWRAYEIYRAYRRNPDRMKQTYEKAISACDKWEKKYTDTKKRMATALWYHALLLDRGGMRPQAITLLQTLLEKYAGTPTDVQAHWHLGEWFREGKRYSEAIPHLLDYQKMIGNQEMGAVAACRAGWCYQELKDIEGMKSAFSLILNNKEYNWGWHWVYTSAMDAANRLKAVGEEQAARAYALKIVDKCGSGSDIGKQANIFLGVKEPKKLWIYPHFQYFLSTDNVSLTGRTKLNQTLHLGMLVRTRYTSKDDPFKGTFTFTPKIDVLKAPGDVKVADDEKGKKSYTVDIVDPDEKGNNRGDWWYWFDMQLPQADSPDGLSITRKWEKAGNTWGECTIRIQANNRWNIYIYLPNEKTNVNNFNTQPNEVRDGGKTFLWYQWYNLNQGMTIKFPVEVGANTSEFYPKIFMDRGIGINLPGQDTNTKETVYTAAKEFTCKLTSENPFPCSFGFPGYQGVTIQQIMK